MLIWALLMKTTPKNVNFWNGVARNIANVVIGLSDVFTGIGFNKPQMGKRNEIRVRNGLQTAHAKYYNESWLI